MFASAPSVNIDSGYVYKPSFTRNSYRCRWEFISSIYIIHKYMNRDTTNWKTENKICLTCKKLFTIPVWRKAKTCSYKCSNNLPKSRNRGKLHSEETKQKMSIAKKGKIPLNILRGDFKGVKNHLYKIDRSELVKSEKKHLDGRYREWMKSVKNRDNWKCRIADVNCDGRLEAHHILNWKDYPELRYEINNGITLCHAHHPRKRSDEAKLSPYFQKLVAEGK